MISYPNQCLYHINKKIKEGDIFIMLKWDEYTAAARELSPSALNLFMYLAKNQDKYEMYLSSKDYCSTFNVSDKTFRNARNELFDKGYLKKKENNNVYFDTTGAYKETKESLKSELLDLSNKIRKEDEDSYYDFLETVMKAKLKDIENEAIYKIEIKKLIGFGEDILRNITESQIKGIL